ncbi:hypothetical protein BB558_006903 [Smittium angustum]|uniref:Uncharacterized protein n=1 Tax=Smittium angustum TaxID=133377 RepID=A0A2U1IWF8_SMIAN|nr:hypothetical protein BB558_006903 [Smittium angustum]
MKFTLVTSLLSATVFSQTFDANTILNGLKRGDILPSIIPSDFKPETNLGVTYVGREMNFGTEYFPFNNETDNLPEFAYNADPNTFYTLALVDPDAPSRADPFPPRPFVGCGRKRFVYVLAKQPSQLPNLTVPAARPGFNIADFAKNNSMTIVGANYFEVEAPPGDSCIVPGASSSGSPSPSSTASGASPSSTASGASPSSTASGASSSSANSSPSSASSGSGTSPSSASSTASPASTKTSSASKYVFSPAILFFLCLLI